MYDSAITRTNVDPFTDSARSVPLVGTVYDALVFPQKAAVIRAAQRDASLLVDEHGQPRVVAEEVTGHFMRRSGAKALARQGTPLARIQWFGRWGGPTVLIYVDEVTQETNDYHDIDATWDDVKCDIARLLQRMKASTQDFETRSDQRELVLNDLLIKVRDASARERSDRYTSEIARLEMVIRDCQLEQVGLRSIVAECQDFV